MSESNAASSDAWYRQPTEQELQEIPLDGSMGVRTGTEGRDPRRARDQAGAREWAGGGSGRSNGGLMGRDVEMEWVSHLPLAFRETYEGLWLRTTRADRLREPANPRHSARAVVRVKSSETATRPGAAPQKGKRSSGRELDEEALALKSRIDRKLRRLAREIKGGAAEKMRRCTGARCRRWCDPDWIYCPWCGSATSDD